MERGMGAGELWQKEREGQWRWSSDISVAAAIALHWGRVAREASLAASGRTRGGDLGEDEVAELEEDYREKGKARGFQRGVRVAAAGASPGASLASASPYAAPATREWAATGGSSPAVDDGPSSPRPVHQVMAELELAADRSPAVRGAAPARRPMSPRPTDGLAFHKTYWFNA